MALSSEMLEDLLTKDTAALKDTSGLGAKVWIENGKIYYDTTAIASQINALSGGEPLTDTITYAIRLANGTLSFATLTITITGTNDVAVISGDASGEATEDESSPTITESGTLSVADADQGENVFDTTSVTDTTVGGALGTLSITAAGAWTYTVANADVQYLGAGDTRIETFTVKSADGTDTETITITITGTNDLATISGDASGEATEDESSPTITESGTLSVADADQGENVFDTTSVTDTTVGGALGTLSITAAGAWTYTVANADVQYLGAGDTRIETFTVKSADGTDTETITITITGANEPVTTVTVANPYTGADPNDFDLAGVIGGDSAFDETGTALPQTLVTTTGSDTVVGSSGSDANISAKDGNDIVYGRAGNDTINGNNGNDLLFGQAGDDDINGNGGDDSIYGGSGNDTLTGDIDADTIFGGSGTDTINGNNGNDVIIGGYGADSLTGGNGADKFKFLEAKDTGDTILDFNRLDGDKLDFTQFDFNTADAAITGPTTVNNSTSVTAHGVSYFASGTADTTVWIDTDGNTGTVEFEIVLKNFTLASGDFTF